MARKVDVKKFKQAQSNPTAGPSDIPLPPPPQPRGDGDSKPQDFLAMWAVFMVVLGIGMLVKLPPWMAAVAGAVLGGVLGQVLPVRDDGKRLPMPVAAALTGVGLLLVLVGILMAGKR